MTRRLHCLAIDTADTRGLARFYQRLLGWPDLDDADEGWVEISDGAGAVIAFQHAPDHRPPTWPAPEVPQQMHLDVQVDDIEEAEPAVLALGARRLEGGGETFRVYADPAGHPFCLVW